MKLPPASWQLPSPAIFTASDPHAADGKAGVGTVLQIVQPNVARPDWQATNGPARVFQAEGPAEVADALEAIRVARAGELLEGGCAVVTILGINPAPFVELGVTSCMVECYAQAGDDPYGNIHRMRWQAKHDGWPHVVPVLGVYDNVPLAHYLEINGGRGAFRGGHWHGGPLAIYLAEGMTDTGSWPLLAELAT